MLSQLPPDVAANLPKSFTAGDSMVNTMYAYADETSIRGNTNSSATMNASVALIGAAIAIPNLLRSRIAANESAAAVTVRSPTRRCIRVRVTLQAWLRWDLRPLVIALHPAM